MIVERVFLDTSFMKARISRRDQYHTEAGKLASLLRSREIWATEAILVEVGNAMCREDRVSAAKFIDACYSTPNFRVVPIDAELMRAGIQLYGSHADKSWGMTDCLSFVVMRTFGIVEALTRGFHFVQAGFRALMRETF